MTTIERQGDYQRIATALIDGAWDRWREFDPGQRKRKPTPYHALVEGMLLLARHQPEYLVGLYNLALREWTTAEDESPGATEARLAAATRSFVSTLPLPAVEVS